MIEVSHAISTSLLLGLIFYSSIYLIAYVIERGDEIKISLDEERGNSGKRLLDAVYCVFKQTFYKKQEVEPELSQDEAASDLGITDSVFLNAKCKIKRVFTHIRSKLQINYMFVAIAVTIPDAVLITSLADSPYSAMAVYWGILIGSTGLWSVVKEPRKVPNTSRWLFIFTMYIITSYMLFYNGFKILEVDTKLKNRLESDASKDRIFSSLQASKSTWAQHVLLGLLAFDVRRKKGIHYRFSSVHVWVLKIGLVAIFFYAWREEIPTNAGIHFYVYQYATQDWSGRHLVFLSIVAGLTFYVVEDANSTDDENAS